MKYFVFFLGFFLVLLGTCYTVIDLFLHIHKNVMYGINDELMIFIFISLFTTITSHFLATIFVKKVY